jgi:Tol biopolymer transport system component
MHRYAALAVAALVGLAVSAVAPIGADATTPPPTLEGRIVFARYPGEHGNDMLFIVNADGSHEQRVLPDEETCCTWGVASDGSQLITWSGDWDPGGLIVDLHDLSWTVVDPPDESLILFPGPFSPDGARIYHNGWDDTDLSRSGVYVASVDDASDAAQILLGDTTDCPPEPMMFVSDVSPDGAQLVHYQRAPGDCSFTHGWLMVSNTDGSNLRRLTDVDVPQGLGLRQWSPDGSKIVFADIEGRLLTINPDGTGLTEVFSQEGGWVRRPVWSPNGSQIMFTLDPTATPAVAPNEIYVINADGSGLTPVITTPDIKILFAWVPDIRDTD